jgi:hypothetical protein
VLSRELLHSAKLRTVIALAATAARRVYQRLTRFGSRRFRSGRHCRRLERRRHPWKGEERCGKLREAARLLQVQIRPFGSLRLDTVRIGRQYDDARARTVLADVTDEAESVLRSGLGTDDDDIGLRSLHEAGGALARRHVADDLDPVVGQQETDQVAVQGVAVRDDDPQRSVRRLLFPKQRDSAPRA